MAGIYFNAKRLQKVLDAHLGEGETFLGYIFTPGKGQKGEEIYFPYLKVEKDGKIIEKEVTDESFSGCPYPPGCGDDI